jgi:hypothetical protein
MTTDSNVPDAPEVDPPRAGRRPDRGSRRKSVAPSVPVWVLVVALVVVGAVAGGGVWLVMSGSATSRDTQVEELKTNNSDLLAQVDDLKAQLASAEASASLESSETAALLETPGTAEVVVTPGKAAFAFIDDVTGSASKGFKISVVYAQLLRGKAAADAAKTAGDDPPGAAPGDYYIIEGSAGPKTLTLAPNAEITVLGWKGAAATASAKITAAEFAKVMPSGSTPQDAFAQGGYNVTVTGGAVTKIEQIYLP